MIKGLKEMRITHECMLDVVRCWLKRELAVLTTVPTPIKIAQNCNTKEFIITFEGEQVKSILPPLEDMRSPRNDPAKPVRKD